MLCYGCTRLEIGVQSIYEDVARDTNRGHTVKAVTESFQMAKDAGFKVVTHMMPDLPNVGLERDFDQFIVRPSRSIRFVSIENVFLPISFFSNLKIVPLSIITWFFRFVFSFFIFGDVYDCYW